jgi:hypothetical protein
MVFISAIMNFLSLSNRLSSESLPPAAPSHQPAPSPPINGGEATNLSMSSSTIPQLSSSFSAGVVLGRDSDSTGDESSCVSSDTITSIIMEPIIPMTDDEIMQIRRLADSHDRQYRSVAFGEELIKEMVMASVFGIPLSPTAAMTGYKLMVQRVTKVSQSFEHFMDLEAEAQTALIKQNADLIVR